MLDIDALYRNHFARLTSFYGEDVAQEAIAAVWKRSLTTPIEDVEKYLSRAAKRIHLSQHRTKKSRVELVSLDKIIAPVIGPSQLIRAELREVTRNFPDVMAAELETHFLNSTKKTRQFRARRMARARG